MPAMSAILEDTIDQFPKFPEPNHLGYKFSAATIGNTSLTTTDPTLVRMGTSESSDYLNNYELYLGTAGESKTVAVAGVSVTGGTMTLTFNAPNATNQAGATTVYLLRPGFSFTYLVTLANDSLEELTTTMYEPIKTIGDSLQGSAVDTDWTESGATDTVDTTATKLGSYGQQVFDVLDSGSGGGYTQMGLTRIPQGTRGRLHGLVQSITGTSTLAIVDGSGNVQDSIGTTQMAEVYLGKDVSFDATDEQARLRLVQTTASGEGYWTSAWFTRADQTVFKLPSYLDARYKIDQVVRRVFHDSGTESNTWLADSYEDVPLAVNDDYYFSYRGGETQPVVVFTAKGKQYLSDPLFVVVNGPYTAPYGKSTVFTSLASTNPCPARTLAAYMVYLIGLRNPDAFPGYEGFGRARVAERVLPRKNESRPMSPRIGILRLRN
jgi:hypothetical protein